MLLTTAKFTGKFSIGQFTLNESLLEDYINNYEERFFLSFFVDDYYDDLQTRLLSIDPQVKADAEKEWKRIERNAVAYIWLQYVSNEQVQLTGAGITSPDEQNATVVNMDVQCLRYYNDMISDLKLAEVKNKNIAKNKLKYRNPFGL
jgi:hypothetical protein